MNRLGAPGVERVSRATAGAERVGGWSLRGWGIEGAVPGFTGVKPASRIVKKMLKNQLCNASH